MEIRADVSNSAFWDLSADDRQRLWQAVTNAIGHDPASDSLDLPRSVADAYVQLVAQRVDALVPTSGALTLLFGERTLWVDVVKAVLGVPGVNYFDAHLALGRGLVKVGGTELWLVGIAWPTFLRALMESAVECMSPTQIAALDDCIALSLPLGLALVTEAMRPTPTIGAVAVAESVAPVAASVAPTVVQKDPRIDQLCRSAGISPELLERLLALEPTP